MAKRCRLIGTLVLGAVLFALLCWWLACLSRDVPAVTPETNEGVAARTGERHVGPAGMKTGMRERSVSDMLKYRGPSFRHETESSLPNFDHRHAISGWSHTRESEKAIEALLSSRRIPFAIRIRYDIMSIVVPPKKSQEAIEITKAAVQAGVLEYRHPPWAFPQPGQKIHIMSAEEFEKATGTSVDGPWEAFGKHNTYEKE